MKHTCLALGLILVVTAIGCGSDDSSTPPAGGTGGSAGSTEGGVGGSAGGAAGGTAGTGGGGTAGAGVGGTAGGGVGESAGGATGGSAGAAGGAGVPIDDAPAAQAGVTCDLMKQCMNWALSLGLAGVDCKAHYTAMAQDNLQGIKAAIAKGTISYDGVKMAECQSATLAQGCDALSGVSPQACKDAVKGLVAVGGDCTMNQECSGDAYCVAQASCPGKCTARAAEGSVCASDNGCLGGLKCSNALCVKPSAQGATCSSSTPPCKTGLMCSGSPKTCKSETEVFAAAEGASCDVQTTSLCQLGLACAFESLQGSTLSFKCTKPVASGAACKFAFPEQCPAGEYCAGTDTSSLKFDGTCKPVPGSGEPCAKGSSIQKCAPEVACVADTTCQSMQHVGGSCTNDVMCYSGACDTGKCIPDDACPHYP